MKLVICALSLLVLLLASASAATYYYAGGIALATLEEDKLRFLYHDRLGTGIESHTLPFGQEIVKGDTFGFTGKELDQSDLHYFNARYYDSDMGRFTRKDPQPSQPSYQYVRNNPTNLVDPSGEWPEWLNNIFGGGQEDLMSNLPQIRDSVCDLSACAASQTDLSTHVVSKRETFMSVWRQFRHKVTYAEFKGINSQIANFDSISPGDIINVPPGSLVEVYPVLEPAWPLIQKAAKKHGVSEDVLGALMLQEGLNDNGYEKAVTQVSNRGAVGLMQLMPNTFEDYGYTEEDMKDPEKNIDAGARHYKEKTIKFGGGDAAFAAYNAGNRRVVKALTGDGYTREEEVFPGMVQKNYYGYTLDMSKLNWQPRNYVKGVNKYLGK